MVLNKPTIWTNSPFGYTVSLIHIYVYQRILLLVYQINWYEIDSMFLLQVPCMCFFKDCLDGTVYLNLKWSISIKSSMSSGPSVISLTVVKYKHLYSVLYIIWRNTSGWTQRPKWNTHIDNKSILLQFLSMDKWHTLCILQQFQTVSSPFSEDAHITLRLKQRHAAEPFSVCSSSLLFIVDGFVYVDLGFVQSGSRTPSISSYLFIRLQG